MSNYDVSRIVRQGDADEPPVERLPMWACLTVDVLAALILWALLCVALRAAWKFWWWIA